MMFNNWFVFQAQPANHFRFCRDFSCFCRLVNASQRICMRSMRRYNWQPPARTASQHSSLSMCPKHVNLVRCHFSYFIFILSNAVSIPFNFLFVSFLCRKSIQFWSHKKTKFTSFANSKFIRNCDKVFQRFISFPFLPILFYFFPLSRHTNTHSFFFRFFLYGSLYIAHKWDRSFLRL